MSQEGVRTRACGGRRQRRRMVSHSAASSDTPCFKQCRHDTIAQSCRHCPSRAGGSSAAGPQATGSTAVESSSGSRRLIGEHSLSGEAMDEDEVSRLLGELPFLPGRDASLNETPAVGATPRPSRGAPEAAAEVSAGWGCLLRLQLR